MLAASERRLLQAARKFIAGGEPYIYPRFTLEPHDVDIVTAIEGCEKYFHGSHVGYLPGEYTGRIEPGNVSEETFKNWKTLICLAYIDRILETGEIK
jgi:hypothetical protein